MPSIVAPGTYLQWNDAVAMTIFRPDMAGRPVLLHVDERLIESIGGSNALAKFVGAVIDGPPWVNPKSSLCQKALQAAGDWRARDLRYPPYLAYLALFVLAVGVAGDFQTYAYYPRLWKLLASANTDYGAPPSFDRMLELWDDLEIWSNRDRGGDLGVFSIRIAGSWIHVGLPKAQAVLTEQERRDLPSLFAVASLDPTEMPNDAELAKIVRQHASAFLRPVTLQLLKESNTEPELFAALLDVIRAELEEWDGLTGASGEGGVAAVARICLRVDDVARRVNATLRISSGADFPHEGLTFSDEDGNAEYTCDEYMPGWSSPVLLANSPNELIASDFDWRRSHTFIDIRNRWSARLTARRVRLFTSGRPFQLPGLIEVRQIARNRPFTIAVDKGLVSDLIAWKDSGEVTLVEIPLVQGLPPGWNLFVSQGATDDHHIRHRIPELALPAVVRLSLRGGIRSSEGNSYFSFARPLVTVLGARLGDVAYIGDRRLQSGEEPDTFNLPERLPCGKPITIEVRSATEMRCRLTFFLEENSEWQRKEPAAYVDGFALRAVTDLEQLRGEVCISGVLLSPGSPRTSYPVWPKLPRHRHFHVLGCRVGEIAAAPSLPFTFSWAPTWVLDSQQRRIEYCGTNIVESEPIYDDSATKAESKLWKDVVWGRRKRFLPPQMPKHAALWRRYLKVASSVTG